MRMTIILLLFIYFRLTSRLATCWSQSLIDGQNLYVHITNESNVRLQHIGDEVKKHINKVIDVSHVVRNVTEKYLDDLDSLFRVMALHEIKYELERQLYFLYLVQASNEILLEKSNMLLEEILVKVDLQQTVFESDEYIIKKAIKKIVDDDKRSNLMYICFTLRICRSFPAVSDHLADLLGEILKLSNTKFSAIVKLLQITLEEKLEFFRSISNDAIVFQIGMQLKHMVEKPLKFRKSMFTAKEVIENKLKLFKSKGDTLKVRTKALRLLIDMFDKAFEGLGTEAVGIEISNLKNTLKDWSKDEIRSIRKPFEEFWNYIIEIIRFDWYGDTMEEVRVLIEILMTGTTSEYSIVCDDLLYKGSKYLNNGFFVSDMDPI